MNTAKFIHLLSVIMWIGPALGGYLFLLLLFQKNQMQDALKFEKIAEVIFRIEHIAFIGLILSGLTLLSFFDWQIHAMPWLHFKLICFAFICIFECFDIWLHHIQLHQVVKSGEPSSIQHFFRLKKYFYFAASPIIVLILIILYCSVFKEAPF